MVVRVVGVMLIFLRVCLFVLVFCEMILFVFNSLI